MISFGVDEILVTDDLDELTIVDLGNKDLLKIFKELAEVLRKRPQVAEMRMRYCISFLLQFGYGALDGSVCAAPAQYQQVSFVRTAIQFLQGYIVSDLLYFFFADLHHQLMILRIIAYISRDILFFQPADTVLQSRSAGDGPGAY